ncbi:uncharacterized protein N7518_000145 [Penicillium psychrosexuale]|uniref:uncharacterized protein n=1 Tax=Penicillium psychrosexuale TaxID=1002107 RepID=UPI0025458F0D|nr:uncharacterized protein N7518_000145 [Penicillium psychrosexuale]KAJ5803842.1 hypothetical protein N7518_000145 [Penicillium psychrosexuale]
MVYTLYEGFVLQTKRALTALSHILHKAEEAPNASNLPSCRLHNDMKSLSYQVFAATMQTRLALAKLSAEPFPTDDTSQDVVYTYAEMYARIDKALQALDTVDKDFILEHCETVSPTPLGGNTQLLSGIAFACIMQANIFFHVTTAYGILRKEGVPLGKVDYILPFITS